MKKLLCLLLILVMASACTRVLVVNSKPKHAPPGQIKKATGSKSAQPYAPGQRKKKG